MCWGQRPRDHASWRPALPVCRRVLAPRNGSTTTSSIEASATLLLPPCSSERVHRTDVPRLLRDRRGTFAWPPSRRHTTGGTSSIAIRPGPWPHDEAARSASEAALHPNSSLAAWRSGRELPSDTDFVVFSAAVPGRTERSQIFAGLMGSATRSRALRPAPRALNTISRSVPWSIRRSERRCRTGQAALLRDVGQRRSTGRGLGRRGNRGSARVGPDQPARTRTARLVGPRRGPTIFARSRRRAPLAPERRHRRSAVRMRRMDDPSPPATRAISRSLRAWAPQASPSGDASEARLLGRPGDLAVSDHSGEVFLLAAGLDPAGAACAVASSPWPPLRVPGGAPVPADWRRVPPHYRPGRSSRRGRPARAAPVGTTRGVIGLVMSAAAG